MVGFIRVCNYLIWTSFEKGELATDTMSLISITSQVLVNSQCFVYRDHVKLVIL